MYTRPFFFSFFLFTYVTKKDGGRETGSYNGGYRWMEGISSILLDDRTIKARMRDESGPGFLRRPRD